MNNKIELLMKIVKKLNKIYYGHYFQKMLELDLILMMKNNNFKTTLYKG